MNDKYFAIYARKSKYTGIGESINVQIDMSKEYLKKKYGDILTEDNVLVFQDEGFSGGTTKRPAFQKMLQLLQNDQLYCIAAYRLDRISRSVNDFTNLYELIRKHHASLFLVNESFDVSTISGKAMLLISSVFAEMERSLIKERITDNLHALSMEGRWLGGTTPTGYRSVSTKINNKPAKKLEVIQEEAKVIELIYKKYLEFQSVTRVESYFIENNILTKNNKPHTRVSIKNILSNPVYCTADQTAKQYFEDLGCTIYNLDDTPEEQLFDGTRAMMVYKKLDESGTTYKANDPKDWIVAIGKHAPIISSKDWVEVQGIIKRNSTKSYHNPRGKYNPTLLSSLLYCSECKSPMYVLTRTKSKQSGEKVYSYSYKCNTSRKSRKAKCSCKSIKASILDKLVLDEIAKLTSPSNSTLIAKLQNAKQSFSTPADNLHSQVSTLQSQIKSLTNKSNNYLDKLVNETDPSLNDLFRQRLKELQDQIVEKTNKLHELETLLNSTSDEAQSIDELIKTLSNFPELLATSNVDQQRAAIRSLIQRIEYDEKANTLKLTFMHSSEPAVVCINDMSQMLCIPYAHPCQTNTFYIHRKCSDDLYIMYSKNIIDKPIFQPLYIHTVTVPSKANLDINQAFLNTHTDLSTIESIGDKLKYCRLTHNMYQSDIASYLHIDRGTYAGWEDNSIDALPIDKLQQLATLYNIDITCLLDEYNLFLYYGQGTLLKSLRHELGLTQQEFANYLNLPVDRIKKWECNRQRMSKSYYKKLFKP